ncbi:MAG: fumarate hydratase [Eubacteriales bacterium]|nr:fumarate hydratase [Eubacteriales bacterium]
MKTISARQITDAVAQICLKANFVLRPDVLARLKSACVTEKNKQARKILQAIIDNAAVARKEKLAICQDTGMPVVFVEIGQEVKLAGDFNAALQRGIARGYREGYLRDSIVADPVARGRAGYTPAVVHTDIVRGDKLKITLLPKGFGCENKSQLKMFKPTAAWAEVKQFVIEAVKAAGPDACPPYVVGVGIGGSADYASMLAKKALLRSLQGKRSSKEQELLCALNALAIGPMGLGGSTTALAVHIQTYATHIAGLPVAVNISCHALRSATVTL